MIPDIIGQSTGRFDQRFFLTALLPTAVFAPATAVVALYARGELAALASWYMMQTAVTQVLASLGAAAVVWFLATLLDSQSRNVVRLYEGYPLVRLFEQFEHLLDRLRLGEGSVEAIGVAGHRYRRHRLRDGVRKAGRGRSGVDSYDEAADVLLYDSYPQDSTRLMPTTLGNILRAAEDYGYHRYGFDSIHLWPRLAAVLPEAYLGDIETSIVKYQAPLMISFGSFVLALGSISLIWATIPTAGFVSIFLGSWAMSWAAYRLSFGAAKAYGDHLRTAIDLYRTDLIERWWPQLLEIEDDRRRLEVLRHFVMTGEKPSVDAIADSRPRIQITDTPGDEEDPPAPDADPDTIAEPRRGVRVSWILAALQVMVVLGGVTTLNRRDVVLVAGGPVGAFQDISGQVKATPMRRGSVGHDTMDAADLRSVQGRITLRRLAKGAVVRRADLSPEKTTPGVVVQLVRRRTQVQALNLTSGDDVFLEGERLTDRSVQCVLTTVPVTMTSASTTIPAIATPVAREMLVPVVEGRVLAVVDGKLRDELGVLLRVEVPGETACLGSLDKVQIARRSA